METNVELTDRMKRYTRVGATNDSLLDSYDKMSDFFTKDGISGPVKALTDIATVYLIDCTEDVIARENAIDNIAHIFEIIPLLTALYENYQFIEDRRKMYPDDKISIFYNQEETKPNSAT